MLSFRAKIDERRQAFLLFAGDIERQLREAYARKFNAGKITQASLAKKLGVNRSVIHRRLNGGVNMSEETIASMVWGLGHKIRIEIYDPAEVQYGTNQTLSFAGADQLSAQSTSGVSVGVSGSDNARGLLDILSAAVKAPQAAL